MVEIVLHSVTKILNDILQHTIMSFGMSFFFMMRKIFIKYFYFNNKY